MIFGFSTPKKPAFTSWALRKYMGTDYSHVYMKMYNPYIGKYVVFEASYGDVHCQTYTNFLVGNKVLAEFDGNLKPNEAKEAIKFVYDQLEKPYSYWAIIGIGLSTLFKTKIGKDGDKKFICSELVARALPHLFKFEGKDYLTPRDIYEKLERCKNVTRMV
jgi:hypothetical protein